MTEESTLTAPIGLTDGAVKQLNLVKESQNIPAEFGLRIGVKAVDVQDSAMN